MWMLWKYVGDYRIFEEWGNPCPAPPSFPIEFAQEETQLLNCIYQQYGPTGNEWGKKIFSNSGNKKRRNFSEIIGIRQEYAKSYF